MINVFYNPVDALLDAKHERSMGKTIGVLAITQVIIVLASLILTAGMPMGYTLLSTVAIGVVSFVLYLLMGLLLKVVLSIIGAKHAGYFEALTALVYAFAPISAAVLVLAILFKVGLVIHPFVGMLLGAVALVFVLMAVVASWVIKIKALMELAGADMLMAVVSVLAMLPVYLAVSVISFVASMSFGGMRFF